MAQIQLPEDFKELLNLLNANRVKYLLVGGYAVGIHGYVRATGDIDIWINKSEENSLKICQALKQFGFDISKEERKRLLNDDQILRMGITPLRAKIMTSISGVDFADCWPSKLIVKIDGIEIPVLALDDLLTNKKASGRHKDLADIDELDI